MQKAIELKNRGLTLRGMLHTPDNFTGKIPIVCIYHGFTGNKVESHFLFVKFSRQLEKHGIASVRFDFGGSGESDGDFADMTITKEVDDAKAILNYAKSLDFVDSNNIGIIGLSMGGVVSSLLARECYEDIKTLCLWAPAGNIDNIVSSYRDEVELPEVNYVDVGGVALGTNFYYDIQLLDLFQGLNQYNKNVLIIHGDNDQVVPLYSSDIYLKAYGDKAKRIIIKGGDHTFNNLVWEKEVYDYTIEYLKEELK